MKYEILSEFLIPPNPFPTHVLQHNPWLLFRSRVVHCYQVPLVAIPSHNLLLHADKSFFEGLTKLVGLRLRLLRVEIGKGRLIVELVPREGLLLFINKNGAAALHFEWFE